MSKQITYGDDSRQAILRGVNRLADAVKRDARPAGPERRAGQEVRLALDHQGRRDGGEGDRAQGAPREHGGADGEGGREQDLRRGRRRHDDGDGAGAGDLPRGQQERHGGRQPDGAQARASSWRSRP